MSTVTYGSKYDRFTTGQLFAVIDSHDEDFRDWLDKADKAERVCDYGTATNHAGEAMESLQAKVGAMAELARRTHGDQL